MEQQKEKRIQKNDDSISSLWYNFKRTNIGMKGIPKGEGREQGIESLCKKKIMESFPNW